jgi:hypothetical protein
MDYTTTRNPKQMGDCHKCGYPIFQGVSHFCPTAAKPMQFGYDNYLPVYKEKNASCKKCKYHFVEEITSEDRKNIYKTIFN